MTQSLVGTNEESRPLNLSQKLDKIEKAIQSLNRRYSWEVKESDTGIQLAGNATVTKTGVLLAACPIPIGPGQLTVALILQDDSGNNYVVPAESAKLITE